MNWDSFDSKSNEDDIFHEIMDDFTIGILCVGLIALVVACFSYLYP